MIIADTKHDFENDISVITQCRRVEAPRIQRVKWLTEFTYAIDSHKNPMVQISDFVCYTTKKFLEVESGYRDHWDLNATSAYRNMYSKIHDRLIRKDILLEEGRYSEQYNAIISNVGVWASRQFKRKVYL